MLRLPDAGYISSHRAVARTARLLVVDAEVGVIRQKIEFVAERANDGTGKILRLGQFEIVERFVRSCKGTVLTRQRRKVNRLRLFVVCGARINANDGIFRSQ